MPEKPQKQSPELAVELIPEPVLPTIDPVKATILKLVLKLLARAIAAQIDAANATAMPSGSPGEVDKHNTAVNQLREAKDLVETLKPEANVDLLAELESILNPLLHH